MRFRVWLPVAQTIAMIFLAVSFHGADARAAEWAEGINLPVVPVVAPLEFAVRKSQSLPNSTIRFYGAWLLGALCWYLVGKFVEEIIELGRTRKLERAPRGDLLFALIAFPSAILMGGAFGFGGSESRIISDWAIVWLVITSADLTFRVAQLIRHRRRPKVSHPSAD